MRQPTGEGSEQERRQALAELEAWLEKPMVLLGLVWLALLVIELVRGLNPVLDALGLTIWGIFVLEFLVRLVLAPDRVRFLRRNVLTLASLLVPALRVLRIAPVLRALRVLRATRGLRLFRIVTALNRGMRVLASSLRRRGFGYVLALTLLVLVTGAAGMFSFEPAEQVDGGFRSYWDALWWTAMLLISIGSEYWPESAEGRTLTLLIALYGFAVLGYITATLASFFISADAGDERAQLAGRQDVETLRLEIRELRQVMEGMGPETGGRSE